jgi:hypothetical protein
LSPAAQPPRSRRSALRAIAQRAQLSRAQARRFIALGSTPRVKPLATSQVNHLSPGASVMTKLPSCSTNTGRQASDPGSSQTTTCPKEQTPAAATSCESRPEQAGSGEGILCESTQFSPTGPSQASRSSEHQPGQRSNSEPTNWDALYDCHGDLQIQTASNSTRVRMHYATLAQRLRNWPLEEVEQCRQCGLPSSWSTEDGTFCVSPACDEHGSSFAKLDDYFRHQGRGRK